jgi:hypothetical protein
MEKRYIYIYNGKKKKVKVDKWGGIKKTDRTERDIKQRGRERKREKGKKEK